MSVALENATRQLRQGHVGTGLSAISEAKAIVDAELARRDEWERDLLRRIMEDDEATTGGHFAPPPHRGMMCCDACDQMDDE